MPQMSPLLLALAMQQMHPSQLPVDPAPGGHVHGQGIDPELRQYINHMRYEEARRAGNITWAEQEPNPYPLPVSMGGPQPAPRHTPRPRPARRGKPMP